MTPRPPLAGPLPADPVAVPVAAGDVPVAPKTPEQLKHSAVYEAWTGFWIAAPGVLIGIGAVSGQLQVLFPKYGPVVIAVCSICASIGKFMRSSQYVGASKSTVLVDHTNGG